MVKRNDNGAQPQGQGDPPEFLSALFGGGVPPAPQAKCPEAKTMKDVPQLLKCFLQHAEDYARAAQLSEQCGCAVCRLRIMHEKVAAFMCRATVEAAYTGDQTKLQTVLAVVESLDRT